MITKRLWEDFFREVDWARRNYAWCIKKSKSTLTILFIMHIVIAPVYIGLDLITLPIQLIYLISYKILWRKEK